MPTVRTALAAALSIAFSAALLSGCASTGTTGTKEKAADTQTSQKVDVYTPGGPNQALDKIAYDKRHSRALNISRLALMAGIDDKESDDQKWITPIDPSVSPHAANAVIGAGMGLIHAAVMGGSASGHAKAGALYGAAFTYSGFLREHFDAWISMIEPKDAPDLATARLVALDKASVRTVKGLRNAGWKVTPLKKHVVFDRWLPFDGEEPRMSNSFQLVKEDAGCPSPDKKLKVDGKDVGCTLTVATFNSKLDAVADMPDWMGGKKDIRFIRSILVMFNGVKTDGKPFLTPSREDVLKIAEQASGDQIFFGSVRRRAGAYMCENGEILKFRFPKNPSVWDKALLKAYQGLPFVKRTEYFGDATVSEEDKVPAKKRK